MPLKNVVWNINESQIQHPIVPQPSEVYQAVASSEQSFQTRSSADQPDSPPNYDEAMTMFDNQHPSQSQQALPMANTSAVYNFRYIVK